MARRTSRTLTDVEHEFIQILWDREEATPEDIQKELLKQKRTLTGGSIRKVLLIMMDKGYIERRKQGKGFMYRAKVNEKQAHGSMVSDLLNHAFGGSAALMVASLLDTKTVPDEDLKKIERMIAERKKGEGK